MTKSEILVSIEGGEVFESLTVGKKVYYVGLGKVLGTVVLKNVVTNAFKDPGNYVHVQFNKDVPSIFLEPAEKMSLQSAETMKVAKILSFEKL